MCELTFTAQKRGCQDISGVNSLLVVDKFARIVAGVTYAVVDGALTITGTGATAYRINPVQNTFSVTNPTNAAPDSNSLFYLQSLAGVFNGNSAAVNSLIENINKGRTEWLIEFTDGTYRMMGTDTNGLQADGGDGFASGQGAGDAKGATLSLSGQSTYIAPTLASYTSFTDAFTVTEPA